MNQEGQKNGNSPIKPCKRGHRAPSRDMQIDENQPLAPLPLRGITPLSKLSLFYRRKKHPKFQALYEPRGATEWKFDDKSVQTWSRSSEQKYADRRKTTASPSAFFSKKHVGGDKIQVRTPPEMKI